MLSREELIEKYNRDGKFDIISALMDLAQSVEDRDRIIGRQENKIRELEDAMAFFSQDWSKRFGNSIIIPSDSEINEFKRK